MGGPPGPHKRRGPGFRAGAGDMTDPRVAFAALPPALRGALWMVGFSATFSLMTVLIRMASETVHPVQIAFFRNLFGLLAILPIVWRGGLSALATRRPFLHLARGLLGFGAMVLLFSSFAYMPVAEATALTFTAPLFATAGAALLLGENVRARRWTATLVGFAGALIVLRPGAAAFDPMAAVALGAAALMAVTTLIIKTLTRTDAPNTIVLYMGLVMTPVSLVPALFVWTPPDGRTWVVLALVGLTATVGQLMLVRAYAAADASAVMPFDFIRLLFVTLAGWFAFAETPGVTTWIGGGVILASSVYIANRESRSRPAPETPPPTP